MRALSLIGLMLSLFMIAIMSLGIFYPMDPKSCALFGLSGWLSSAVLFFLKFEGSPVVLLKSKGFSRETTWVSNIDPDNVHSHKIKDLNSEHLANIIYFLKNDSRARGHAPCILSGMVEEAKRRELTPEFLAKAPYPYDAAAPYQEYQSCQH